MKKNICDFQYYECEINQRINNYDSQEIFETLNKFDELNLCLITLDECFTDQIYEERNNLENLKT